MTLVHKPSPQKVGETLLARRALVCESFPGLFLAGKYPGDGNWLGSRPGKAGFLQNRGKISTEQYHALWIF